MTIDEIKQFQASLGIAIEVAQNIEQGAVYFKGGIGKDILGQAMEMSGEYERLVRQTQNFCNKVDPSHLKVSEVW